MSLNSFGQISQCVSFVRLEPSLILVKFANAFRWSTLNAGSGLFQKILAKPAGLPRSNIIANLPTTDTEKKKKFLSGTSFNLNSTVVKKFITLALLPYRNKLECLLFTCTSTQV
jgi:hypothetical protein